MRKRSFHVHGKLNLASSLVLSSLFVILVGFALYALLWREESDIIADSVVDFSTKQGKHGWHYGYYNESSDTTASGYDYEQDFQLFPKFFREFKATSLDVWAMDTNHWAFLGGDVAHPNSGRNSSETLTEIWSIRRWVSSYSGAAILDGKLSKMGDRTERWCSLGPVKVHDSERTHVVDGIIDSAKKLNIDVDSGVSRLTRGVGGDGVMVRIYQNGVILVEEVVGGFDTTGITFSLEVEMRKKDVFDFAVLARNADFDDTTIVEARFKRGKRARD